MIGERGIVHDEADGKPPDGGACAATSAAVRPEPGRPVPVHGVRASRRSPPRA
ncbi:hypothetical protein F0L17_19450 [Streptomyces sp. TRM43335]|uniref:Uncharacterized protein n=1 Tax=Streptomyces taklimakanensis TaxID=2569853 RepID=A0A6G2BG36_9ACTN|nr:hypothetical protein [Streptomyces taklimakanensis]MTE21251.1 hypothetical protein [Streptomyces taklimakanensis]